MVIAFGSHLLRNAVDTKLAGMSCLNNFLSTAQKIKWEFGEIWLIKKNKYCVGKLKLFKKIKKDNESSPLKCVVTDVEHNPS